MSSPPLSAGGPYQCLGSREVTGPLVGENKGGAVKQVRGTGAAGGAAQGNAGKKASGRPAAQFSVQCNLKQGYSKWSIDSL